jgi:hypothetical protein
MAIATWSTVPSHWRFFGFYVVLGFVFEFASPLSSRRKDFVQNVLVCGAAPLVFRWWFPGAWDDNYTLVHLVVVASLGLVLGGVIGGRARVAVVS